MGLFCKLGATKMIFGQKDSLKRVSLSNKAKNKTMHIDHLISLDHNRTYHLDLGAQ